MAATKLSSARVSALVEPKASKRAFGRLAEGGDVGQHHTSCRQNLWQSQANFVNLRHSLAICVHLRQSPSNGSFYVKDCHCLTEIASLSRPVFLAPNLKPASDPSAHELAVSANTMNAFINTACQVIRETETFTDTGGMKGEWHDKERQEHDEHPQSEAAFERWAERARFQRLRAPIHC